MKLFFDICLLLIRAQNLWRYMSPYRLYLVENAKNFCLFEIITPKNMVILPFGMLAMFVSNLDSQGRTPMRINTKFLKYFLSLFITPLP
jgi:hypothetical protein